MKWLSGVSGCVEISLWGVRPERVLNMALSRGITIWDIRHEGQDHYRLKVSLGGYKALRAIIRRSSCRVKIMRKQGVPFCIMRAKRRKVLVFGTFFFFLCLYFFSSFVWVLEVAGNKLVPTKLILEKSQEFGLRQGVPKAAVDRTELAERLLLAIPELSWVGIHAQGTKIIIEVAEKTLPPDDEEKVPADLLARLDGTIEELLVLAGTPMVKEGDKVKKGQILIAGVVYPQIVVSEEGIISPGGEPKPVRAKGVIRARVVRTSSVQCPIQEKLIKDTGAECSSIILKLFGKEIYLRGQKEEPYAKYRLIRQAKTLLDLKRCNIPGLLDLKRYNFPGTVELVTIIYKEQVCEIRQWGIEGAYQEAARRAHDILKRDLPPDCKIVNRRTEPIPVPDKGLVALKYVLETVENIGIYAQKRP